MFLATNGDYKKTVEYCVNYGRDNDCSASVAGAIAGAYQGASAISQSLIEQIEQINPAPSFRTLATKLCDALREEDQYLTHVYRQRETLFALPE